MVLSACDTGLGAEVSSEGLISLTRAFQYAGARSVLASLWSVEDRSTSKLMGAFYSYLAQGVGKEQALQRAQIAVIRGARESRSENDRGLQLLGVPDSASAEPEHPYFWAAFQLIGDWN